MSASSNSGCWVKQEELADVIDRARRFMRQLIWRDYLQTCRAYQYRNRFLRSVVRRKTTKLVSLLAENKRMLKATRRSIECKLNDIQALTNAPAQNRLVFISRADMEWLIW